MKYASSHLKRVEAIAAHGDTVRFLRDKVALSLPQSFDSWKHFVYGGGVHTCLHDGQVYFYSSLSSVGMDFSVHAALAKAGVNTPCRTMGDIVAGKMIGHVPVSALLEYGERHRDEISAWLKAGNTNGGYIPNKTYACPISGRAKPGNQNF